MNYGTSGIGSTHHLTGESFSAALGINMVHVPFKGMGQATPALVGGQVQMIFSALPAIAGFVGTTASNCWRRTPNKRFRRRPTSPPSPRQPSPALTSRPPPS